jgi:hypothetical protein
MMAKFAAEKMKCDKTVQFERDKCVLDITKKSEQCDINLSTTKTRYEDIIKIKNKEIQDLKGGGTYKYKFWDTPLWTGLAVGVVTTLTLSFGVYYAYGR